MYPPSFLYWLGGLIVIIGLLGILTLFVVWIDTKAKKHVYKDEEDKNG